MNLLTRIFGTKDDSQDLIKKIRAQKLTYLSDGGLNNIFQAIKKIESEKLHGIFVETGCALGGSAILIGKGKSKNRELYVYDIFGMIPPPTDKDGEDVHERFEKIKSGNSIGLGGDKYYGYQEDLLNKVKQNFKKFNLTERNNIHFVQGLYEETLKINQPVAFAHIDCDWYSSVMTCLKEIEPNLVSKGVLIIDDYYDWSGCKTAVDEYFAGRTKEFAMETKNEKLIITKK